MYTDTPLATATRMLAYYDRAGAIARCEKHLTRCDSTMRDYWRGVLLILTTRDPNALEG
jgi:hypothetical protein